MNTIGSVWQKWDLHIHTPASYHWQGQRFEGQSPEQQDVLCKKILDAMDGLDVVAFCIMDYWTFDGFIKLRDYIRRNPDGSKKKIFPGIEFRMAAPVNFRLNTHVLLSDEVTDESLSHFISHLKLADYEGKPPTKQHLVELGKSYDAAKMQIHGCTPEDKADQEKMHRLGLETALVTRDSVIEAIRVVGKEHCLVIQPYDTSDGLEDLDWKRHPYTDSYLMKWADCFEAKDSVHVDLFLGRGHKTKPHLGVEFIENLGGYPKPVFRGSDAHKIKDYGVFPSNRATWLKAQPTFKGLMQVCHEPPLRCHIGGRPNKLDHVEQNPTKYVKSLALAKVEGAPLIDEEWFHGRELSLNPGLIAVIGNKGSGKSALADILALCGNSHCPNMEFLNDKRFRSAGNKSQYFVATLAWADGTSKRVGLGNDFDPQEPERIRYLPQHFIEDLCNEIASGNETNFGRELRKVIFSHVSEEDQLGHGSLDELLEYLIEARKEAIAQEQQSLVALNDVILRNEQEISSDRVKAYEKSLALKQLELDALEKTPLEIVPQPTEDPNDEQTKAAVTQINEKSTELETLGVKLSALKDERQLLVAEQAKLNRLSGHVDNFLAHHAKFVDDHSLEFEGAGFKVSDIVAVHINHEPLVIAKTRVSERLGEIAVAIDGQAASGDIQEVKGLEAIISERRAAIALLQEGLNAPQKKYQTYLREALARQQRKDLIVGSAEKTETIEYFKERIRRAKEVIPAELELLRNDRRSIVRKLHSELLAIRDIFVNLYAPVQKIASEAAKSADAIQLDFDASVAVKSFESDFLAFMHRGRTGSFQGDEESKAAVKSLLKSHDFNDTESVVAFTDAVMDKLSTVERDGVRTNVQIALQLRDKSKIRHLYDFIFGLGFLEIRYNLKLGGKEISQLSPGEKGALLLVFYLLLDTEEIPIIIDQPEHNLDNESVVRLLVDCIRKARARRQVFIVTHNPNLAVYCDADQIICCNIDKADGHKIDYSTGAIEDYDINSFAVNVLEGTYAAFDNRRRKWHKPQVND